MTSIVIIGMTGEGKSEVVKEMIEGKKCLIYDQNNEYGPVTKYPNQKKINLSSDTTKDRSRHVDGDLDLFLKQVATKKGTIVVFEEATGFLQGKISNEFKRIITNKMFTKNVYIMIFHSIIDVPQPIMRLCNVVVLFRTNDEEHFIEKKYPRLLPYYRKLQQIGVPGSRFKIKMI